MNLRELQTMLDADGTVKFENYESSGLNYKTVNRLKKWCTNCTNFI